MSTALKQRLGDDVKAAMRAGEKVRLGTLRLIQAAIKQREVDQRIVLDDTGIIDALDKMAKQRRESIEQFAMAGRQDLVDKEAAELALIVSYLPEALGEDELKALIDKAIAETNAVSVKDLGRLMAVLKPQVQGRCDLAQVSSQLKQRLS